MLVSDSTALAPALGLHTRSRAHWQHMYYAAGIFGFLLRIALWAASEGTNDIRTWARFGQYVNQYGLGNTYYIDALFNHPPLMGQLARHSWRFAVHFGLPFAQCFKLFGLVFELASALLLVVIWRRRGLPERAAQAFAGYGCALCAILISGYHGNTDPAYWFLVLLSVYLLQDRDTPLLAGLALGAALNVKLIPMLIALPLLVSCRDRRRGAWFTLGCAIAMLPFLHTFVAFTPDQKSAFVRNVLGYTSYREWWGVELVTRALAAAFKPSLLSFALDIEDFGAFYAIAGSRILLTTTSALAIYQLIARRPGLDAYAMAGLCFCLFLLMASGFGVQYLGSVVPLLFARSIRDGVAVATTSGVFIGLIYCSFVQTWSPIFSQHYDFSPAFVLPSCVAWWTLARSAARIWRTRDWPAAESGDVIAA